MKGSKSFICPGALIWFWLMKTLNRSAAMAERGKCYLKATFKIIVYDISPKNTGTYFSH